MLPLSIKAGGNIENKPLKKSVPAVTTSTEIQYQPNLRQVCYGSNKKITVTSLHTTNYGTIMESISITSQLKMLPLERTVQQGIILYLLGTVSCFSCQSKGEWRPTEPLAASCITNNLSRLTPNLQPRSCLQIPILVEVLIGDSFLALGAPLVLETLNFPGILLRFLM